MAEISKTIEEKIIIENFDLLKKDKSKMSF